MDISMHLVKDVREGKVLQSVLLALTYMNMGISNTLPNATSEMLVAHLGLSLEEEDRRLSISFSYRLLGFVCGYICGGVAFDYFILPMEQQALFSFMVIVLAFINGAIPFIINIVRLGIVLFLSGLIMSFITTGLVAYALALYGINSHTCLQFIYALNQLGEVATKLAVRLDYENIQIESHIALSYETKKEIFNKIIISFSCLTIATIFMAVTWICLYRFSPPEFKTDVPFDENRQRKASSIGFQALAVVTTLPLLINANFFSSVYDYLLSLHISKRLNRVVSVHDNILHLYFGCSVIGKYIAVGLAYKFLSPFWMIIASVSLEMIASIMMASTGSNEDLLWWSMGLLGLSTAPIYAATIARLNTQVMINGKVLGCLFAASTITILTSDFWLDVMITNYTEAPIYFIILSPILYAIVFAIQLSLFKLERDEEEAFLQPSEEDFSSLNSSKTDVVDVSSVQDNSSTRSVSRYRDQGSSCTSSDFNISDRAMHRIENKSLSEARTTRSVPKF